MWSVTAAGPRLVAAGTAGDHSAAVWTSVDGITWSRGPHDEAVFGGPSTQVLTYERADVGGDYELIATTGNIEALGCRIIASDTAQFSTNDDPETYLANEVGFLGGDIRGRLHRIQFHTRRTCRSPRPPIRSCRRQL